MAFGVATGNPFALLGGDEENDDPQKIMLPPQEALEVKSDQPPEGSDYRSGRGRSDRRGGHGRGGGRRGDHSQSRSYGGGGYDGFESSQMGPTRQTGRSGGGGGGGATRGRGGGRGGRGGFREGKQREYDRRDQTGRGHEVEKRSGGGKGNWGGAADTWDEPAPEAEQPAQNGAAVVEGEAPTDAEPKEAGAEGAEEKEKEEEVEKLTLAEYEEMRKEKVLIKVAKKVEVDMGQFKGLSKLVKDDEETGFEALELEKTKRMKQKARKELVPVKTGFRVGDPVRRGRGRGPGRGGRGSRDLDREGSGGGWGGSGSGEQGVSYNAGESGGGGYRGRGRGRGDRRPGSYGGSGSYGGFRSQPKQPSLTDEASFPSLS